MSQGSRRTSPKDRSPGLRSARPPANYRSTWDRAGKEHGCTSGGTARGEARRPGRKKNQQDADGGEKITVGRWVEQSRVQVEKEV